MNELIKTEIVPAELFENSEQLDQVLNQVEQQVLSEVPDLLSKPGRARIRSLAYQVSRSKTYLDNLGKDLIADAQAHINSVNAERKKAREFLDKLRDQVREPLEKYELRAQIMQAHEEAILMNEQWNFEQKKKAEIRKQEEENRQKDESVYHPVEQCKLLTEPPPDKEQLFVNDLGKFVTKQEIFKQEKEKEQKRGADKLHRISCFESALSDFLNEGIGRETARQIIRLIAAEKISHIRMRY
jgi:hypothetical protein